MIWIQKVSCQALHEFNEFWQLPVLAAEGIEISHLSCQAEVADYGRRQAIHDAVFEENSWDELGARAGDVRAPDLWCIHDRECSEAPFYLPRVARPLWHRRRVLRQFPEDVDFNRKRGVFWGGFDGLSLDPLAGNPILRGECGVDDISDGPR